MGIKIDGLDGPAGAWATTYVRTQIRCHPLSLYKTRSSRRITATKDYCNRSDTDRGQYFSTGNHPTNPPEKEDGSVSFLHDNDVNEDNEGVGWPAVYAIATSTDRKMKNNRALHMNPYTSQQKTRIVHNCHLL